MKKLIRQIIKEESSTQTKLLKAIEKLGILQTIKMVGGYEMFVKFLPDYFDKNNKIELINEFVEKNQQVEEGPIYLYELIGQDYTYDNGVDDEGNDVVTYISSIDTDSAGYYVNMYDDEVGSMYADPIDDGYLKLSHLDDSALNDIFGILVDEYL